MMKQQGFTLLELSIVLVIIGLIAGGVIAGQEMIKSAELRSVIQEQDQYMTAIYGFREKYGSLPGDFKDATLFWPGVTTNGNGDGLMDWGNSYSGDEDGTRAWQHLALSGFIPGQYSGVDANNICTPGTNAPSAKIGGGYSIHSHVDTTYGFSIPIAMQLGKYSGRTQFGCTGALMSPNDAWSIDKKIDDGAPYSGRVFGGRGWDSVNGWSGNCGNEATTMLTYALTNPNKECFLRFQTSSVKGHP